MIRGLQAAMLAAAAALALAGCDSASPHPALKDMTPEHAVLTVPYNRLVGPSRQRARQASDPIAERYCKSHGKTAGPPAYTDASSLRDGGIHRFTYPCRHQQ